MRLGDGLSRLRRRGRRGDRIPEPRSTDVRALFHHLVNREPGDPIAAEAAALLEAEDRQARRALEQGEWPLIASCTDIASLPAALEALRAAGPQLDVRGDGQVQVVLEQQAPMALLDGCLLQNVAHIRRAHTRTSALLFRIYKNRLGDHQVQLQSGRLFAQALGASTLARAPVHAAEFAAYPGLLDASLRLPAWRMALACHTGSRWPELVGAVVAACCVRWEQVFEGREALLGDRCTGWLRRDPELRELAIAAAQELVSEGGEAAWIRFRGGLVSALRLAQCWLREVELALSPKRSTARQQMIALVARKARYAAAHHRRSRLEGESLRDLFDRGEPTQLVDALARSPHVVPGHPEQSPLLRHVEFGGAMFGVFSEEEQQVLHRWVCSLAAPAVPDITPLSALPAPLISLRPPAAPATPKPDLRGLFHQLVNAEQHPGVTPHAHAHVLSRLHRARRLMLMHCLPKHLKLQAYEREAVNQQIERIYDRQIAAYKPFAAPPMMSHEAWTWLMVQLAPMVLVDGAWLQHTATVSGAGGVVSSTLFHIYADEIGDGDVVKNHANVYRELLASQDARLPEFDSRAFARSPLFVAAAFSVPVFQLAMSLFPKSLLPELIGLNLAIEMNGLGAEYMTFIDELKYWGFDPHIVALHLTIDNKASGHTAWAIETVHNHLDRVRMISGDREVELHWRRIWTGYIAFRVVNAPMQLALVRQLGTDVVLKALGRRARVRTVRPAPAP